MKKFKTITAAEILSKELAEIPFVIEHLLPNGLSLLAGSPKVGKSWFALWLSIQIANGEKVFDFETAKGTVLFLALEDNEIRIQNRLLEIIDIAPDNIHFCTEISKLGGELETRIKNFVCENQNTKLIIIDTLQTVRTGTESSYASDYSDLMILKKLADEYGIAILLIHHFRKQKDSDTFHQISGSTGLQGVADTMFTMTQSKRGEKSSVLNCIGRDIEPREIEMERTDENCWIKLSDSLSETTLSDLNFINAVDIFMSDKVIFSGSATELSSLLNVISDEHFSNKVISKNIKKLSKRFEKLGILGVSRRSNGKRIVELIRIGDDSDDEM